MPKERRETQPTGAWTFSDFWMIGWVLFGVGCTAVGAFVLGWEALFWLRTAEWQNITFAAFLEWVFQVPVEVETEWLGLDRIIAYCLHAPAWVVIPVLGWIFSWWMIAVTPTPES